MRHPKYALFATASYIVLVGTFVIVSSRIGNSQGKQAGPDVRVVNTASEPVPVALNGTATVTGNVNVTNTPNVNVANTVTTIPGLPGTPFGGEGSPGITVPAGRHLVIETLSLQVDVSPIGGKIQAFVHYTSGGQNVTMFVPVTYAVSEPSTGFDIYVATQSVRLYADPGTLVYVTAYTPTGNSGTLFLSASGYTI